MHTVLIAGAGQLGSRHLQGVKTSTNELDIWVYDLSEESLKVAEERYNQVESLTFKIVHFVQSLDLVPTDIDVTIVASSSKPRYAIVTELLAKHNIKYMVLEKFLFPRFSDYDEIAKLLDNKGVKTYVNCPRRMYESYDIVKQHIDSNNPVIMTYKDQDWGLCCNTIHYVDIFMQLSSSSEYSLNIDGIIPEVIDSKRGGYVELMGEEKITTPNGSTLTLASTLDFEGNSDVLITNGDTQIAVKEGEGIVIVNGIEYPFAVKYQSGLSGVLVDNLIATVSCPLVSYAESAFYHKTFLSVIAPFINKLKGWTSDSCPIT